MLNQIEKERIEQLEKETEGLRRELTLQRMVISGFLHNLLRSDPQYQTAFFSVLRGELNKLPQGSTHQDYTYQIQKWIDLYK